MQPCTDNKLVPYKANIGNVAFIANTDAAEQQDDSMSRCCDGSE